MKTEEGVQISEKNIWTISKVSYFGSKTFKWVNIVDMAIATTINFFLWLHTKYSAKEEMNLNEKISVLIRVMWFAMYAGLTAGLVWLMVFQASYLPKPPV